MDLSNAAVGACLSSVFPSYVETCYFLLSFYFYSFFLQSGQSKAILIGVQLLSNLVQEMNQNSEVSSLACLHRNCNSIMLIHFSCALRNSSFSFSYCDIYLCMCSDQVCNHDGVLTTQNL